MSFKTLQSRRQEVFVSSKACSTIISTPSSTIRNLDFTMAHFHEGTAFFTEIAAALRVPHAYFSLHPVVQSSREPLSCAEFTVTTITSQSGTGCFFHWASIIVSCAGKVVNTVKLYYGQLDLLRGLQWLCARAGWGEIKLVHQVRWPPVNTGSRSLIYKQRTQDEDHFRQSAYVWFLWHYEHKRPC